MADTPKKDFRRLGVTGLPVTNGWVSDEPLRELQGERGRKTFREMSEQDPIIGGILLGVEMLARQVAWTVKPADDSNKAEKVATFFDEALTDMSPTWGSALSEILSMLIYGWSWLEVVYKRREGLDLNSPTRSSRFDDGKIGWASWSIRAQTTLWEWDYTEPDGRGELRGMWQQPPFGGPNILIPRSKSLHFVLRSRKENPEGASILRNAFRPWYFKNNIEKIEGIGIERDLAGLPVLSIPPELFSSTASTEEQALFASLQKLVTSIKRDEQEGILLPMSYSEDGKNPLYKLELLATGGERQFDTNAIISRYDDRIAMSMLADFILMGHDAVGSYALSTTKTGLFSTAMSAILDIVVDEINTQAFPRLALLNGWSLKHVPTLQHGKVEAADLGKLGEFLKQLYSAGMQVFPNPALEAFLMEQAGLPADSGAGEYPVVDEEGNNIIPMPAQPGGTPPPTGNPAQQVQPSPGAAAAGVKSKRGAQGASRPRPVDQRQRAATGKVAATEGKKNKHFTPLPVRVAKLTEVLKATLGREMYLDLLEQVNDRQKFSELDEEFQQAIEDAEAGE